MFIESTTTDRGTAEQAVADATTARSSAHTVDPAAFTGAPANAGTVAIAQAVVVTGAFGAVLTLAAIGRAANRAAQLAHGARVVADRVRASAA